MADHHDPNQLLRRPAFPSDRREDCALDFLGDLGGPQAILSSSRSSASLVGLIGEVGKRLGSCVEIEKMSIHHT